MELTDLPWTPTNFICAALFGVLKQQVVYLLSKHIPCVVVRLKIRQIIASNKDSGGETNRYDHIHRT